ncbi:MAG: C4-type zinc ribbon domain-containing protein [Nitrospirota bacterium]
MALQLEGLLQLQHLDQQKTIHRDRLTQFPAELERARQRVAAAQQAKAAAEQGLAHCQQQRRTKEVDLQAQEERLAKLKTRLSEIKTNKEYHAHLAEIETAKQGQTAIEDELLLLMEQGEALAQQLKQRETDLAKAGTEAAADEARLAQERQHIEQKLARLEEETAQLEQTIDPALLKEYQRLRRRWKGPVIVPIQNGCCMGCRLAVLPQLIAEVRRHESAQYCQNCGRFLYWPVTSPTSVSS